MLSQVKDHTEESIKMALSEIDADHAIMIQKMLG